MILLWMQVTPWLGFEKNLLIAAQPGGAVVLQDERDGIARGVFTSLLDLKRN
jgi:hypothetical protein